MIKNKKVGMLTLGCKVNQYESEAIAEALAAFGITAAEPDADCDAFIVNTCTVTAEADRKSRQMIRRLHAANPSAPIIVTGCTAQSAPQKIAEMEGVRAVCGNAEKLKCASLASELIEEKELKKPSIYVPDIESAPFEKMSLRSFPRTRVYIKIEDGCENRCAYCAIPAARGSVRSKHPDDVLREVSEFVADGCPEIVLTGIETASYGRDLDGVTLADLLCRVDEICDKTRIRLGSIYPTLLDEEFVSKISKLKHIAPHFHISLQSGSTKTLAAMNRRYTAEEAAAAMARLRAAMPDVMFTTDVIVGFPGESEKEYAETRDFLTKNRFLTAHIFPYSPREGTPAAAMPDQVSQEDKKRRAASLAALQKQITREILTAQIEKAPIRSVLFETFSNGKATGHTDSFIEIIAPSDVDIKGKEFSVRLLRVEKSTIIGEIIKK